MCGGTVNGHLASFSVKGLSPRVRGNPTNRTAKAIWRRSIPACAGEPAIRTTTPLSSGVYPRVCGGTRGEPLPPKGAIGLSPRVRGNRPPLAVLHFVAGSIPACAGEPPPAGRAVVSHRVYPRVCGGTGIRNRRRPARHGLSPRVRGNLLTLLLLERRQRSIPACAGEPNAEFPRTVSGQVYPRVCGGTARQNSLRRR